MLRARLAARLAGRNSHAVSPSTVARICAATEMAYTASLCHDDVIHSGWGRRGLRALWRVTARSCAVLIGDQPLCEALHPFDITGSQQAAGKTLRADLNRQKSTLLQLYDDGAHIVQERICDLWSSALVSLGPWPRIGSALTEFSDSDINPVFGQYGMSVNVGVRPRRSSGHRV